MSEAQTYIEKHQKRKKTSKQSWGRGRCRLSTCVGRGKDITGRQAIVHTVHVLYSYTNAVRKF